jgi:hypothetical protein
VWFSSFVKSVIMDIIDIVMNNFVGVVKVCQDLQ